MATVNIGAIETVLGMTGLALEKAGYSDALKLVKDSFAAECTVCGVKISGAAILSEQRQVLSRYAKEGVVLYRGPDALAWENLDENKCVKPGCNSTTYRLSWTDSETRHIFNSVLSRFETSFPLPEDIQNFSRVLKSDLISFQTSLSLEEITKFYREAFRMQGLIEDGLVTSMSEEHISLAFLGLPDERMVVVQAIDLGYKTEQDLRHVSLRTEKGPSLSGSDIEGFQGGKRIQLVEDRKETFTYIYVEIIGTGDLLMAASVAGEGPRKYLDRDSLGYWLIVSCDQKGRVVKALIEKLYRKDAPATPEIQAIFEGKGDLQDSETLDNLLLHLMEKLYKGNPLAVQEFIELLKANGIDYHFHTEA